MFFGAPGRYTPPTPFEQAYSYVTDWWDHQLDGDWAVTVPLLLFMAVFIVVLLADRRNHDR